jgi:hypothetical protein
MHTSTSLANSPLRIGSYASRSIAGCEFLVALH